MHRLTSSCFTNHSSSAPSAILLLLLLLLHMLLMCTMSYCQRYALCCAAGSPC
jgi:hypothetical protein